MCVFNVDICLYGLNNLENKTNFIAFFSQMFRFALCSIYKTLFLVFLCNITFNDQLWQLQLDCQKFSF
jgi:hypothetical protein